LFPLTFLADEAAPTGLGYFSRGVYYKEVAPTELRMHAPGLSVIGTARLRSADF
jgi:hypothetical protein